MYHRFEDVVADSRQHASNSSGALSNSLLGDRHRRHSGSEDGGPCSRASSSGSGHGAVEVPPPFRSVPDAFSMLSALRQESHSEAAPDLERWLASFYQYFQLKGYRGVVALTVLHLAALAFTFAFSFTVFYLVDWHSILSCENAEKCASVSFFYDQPMLEIGFGRGFVLVFFLLFATYLCLSTVNTWHTLNDALDMNRYYKDRLCIYSDDILATMQWSEVVSRLVEEQRTNPFCIVQDELTVLEVTNILMREDNFLIALANQDVLGCRLPHWVPVRLLYTRTVLGCLRTAMFRGAFNSRSRLREEFLTDPQVLVKRFRWLGVLSLVLVVPVLIFVVLVFFMRHAEEFRSQRTSPFKREWTDFAKWTFREFDELPHQFKERMRAAQVLADSFEACTEAPTPVRDSVVRFLKFAAGSVLAVLLMVAFWDDAPLLYVKLQDKNLLSYLAMFGFLFALADSVNVEDRSLPSASMASAPLLMHTAMMRLVRCTHHLPAHWRAPAPLSAMAGDCSAAQRASLCKHFRQMRREFLGSFFVHRIQVLGEELLGVVLAPVMLMINLPEAAPEIVNVMRRCRHASDHLGDFCVFGGLDVSRHGSAFYGARAHVGAGSSSARDPPRGAQASWEAEGGLALREGKLEKSVVSFVLAHRVAWSPATLIDGSSPGKASSSRGPSARRPSGRAEPQALFSRKPSGGDEEAQNIPMQELPAQAPAGLDRRDSEAGDEEGGPKEAVRPKLSDEHACTAAWGYPQSALALVHELEDFHGREFGPCADTAQRALYAMFPEDLNGMERATLAEDPPALCPPQQATSARRRGRNRGPLEGPASTGSCSSHFFWLELLHDFCTGRHATHLGDAGGGATFEVLERPVVDHYEH